MTHREWETAACGYISHGRMAARALESWKIWYLCRGFGWQCFPWETPPALEVH